ncbi:unnamed protein product [Linum trigynum]|uniref:RNase H type-1 domain-containing protein n=1 Tax=Linum trigynum TaxID=586398 RepID=A0AAV2CW13_9ROSI
MVFSALHSGEFGRTGSFGGMTKTLSPPSLNQAIKSKAALWYQAWMTPIAIPGGRVAPTTRTLAAFGWKSSPSGWAKLNVDGAAGGVLRDADKNWMGGFISCLESCSAMMAELWVIYH